MKKRLLPYLVVFIVCVCMSDGALADLRIEWGASGGGTTGGFYYMATPLVGILGSGTGNSALAQLVWSPDNVADEAHEYTVDYHHMTGNDVWLADWIITEDGIDNDGVLYDSYATFDAGLYTNDFAAGYVYARIFQDDIVQEYDWYYVGPIVAAQDLESGSQVYEMNRDTQWGDPIDWPEGEGGHGYQAVPEPGTLSLFVLGTLFVGWIRRKR